ncbi:MAG TPA: hypothetical protein VJN43_06935 [Bryobacteraceae bacterium]|nr:hypothetical protein [Bryobacteraceae bacterium]
MSILFRSGRMLPAKPDPSGLACGGVLFLIGMSLVTLPVRAQDAGGLIRSGRAGVQHEAALKMSPRPDASAATITFAAGPSPSAAAPVAIAVDSNRQRLYAVHRAAYGDIGINSGALPTDCVSVVDLKTGRVVDSLPVGGAASGEEQGIALDTVRNRLYVSNYDDGTVSVIDLEKRSQTGLDVRGHPSGLAIDPANGTLYVAVASANVVLVISPDNAQVASISIAGSPHAIAVDRITHRAYVTVNAAPWTVAVLSGSSQVAEVPLNFLFTVKGIAVDPGSRVYVSDHNSGLVSAIDISGDVPAELARFTAGVYPDSLAVDSTAHRVYVADVAQNVVTAFDASGSKIRDFATLRDPYGLAIDESGGRAYAGNLLSDSVTVLDLHAQAVLQHIPLGTLTSSVAYDAASRRIYAANYVADAVSVIDAATHKLVASWPCGAGPWAVAVDPALGQVYTLNADDGTIAVLSSADGALKGVVPAGPFGAGVLAVDSATHRVYASSGINTNNTVTILNGITRSIEAAVPVGNTPVGVAVDPASGHVFVANQQSGTISVMDSASNQVIETWHPARANVWGLAVDPGTRRLYATAPPATIGSFSGLEILDADQGTALGEVAGGSGTDLVIVDPASHAVYFSDSDAGTVTVVDGLNPAAVFSTGSGAHSLALAASGAVYVGNYLDGTISEIAALEAGPAIPAGGVVNAASFASGGVAPGEIVTIFGTGMGLATLTTLALDQSGKVATELSGTEVLFDGIPAPLVYTYASQISAIVPYEVAGQTATEIVVEYQGARSANVTVPVASAAPGLFTISGDGKGQAAALNDDYTVNSATRPAHPHSVVMLFATGEGQTNPVGVDGSVAGGTLPRPLLPVRASVGGRDVAVLYAGAAPGAVAGLIQVNIELPADIVTGNALPVAISVGGVRSQSGVTIAIH